MAIIPKSDENLIVPVLKVLKNEKKQETISKPTWSKPYQEGV